MYVGYNASAYDDYVGRNRIAGLGSLAGKSAQRGLAQDQDSFAKIGMAKREAATAYNTIRQSAAQMASQAEAVRRQIYAAEAQISGDSFFMPDSSGTVEVDDAVAELGDIVAKAEDAYARVREVDVPANYVTLDTSGYGGQDSWSYRLQLINEDATAIKALRAQLTKISGVLNKAARTAQMTVQKAQQAAAQEAARQRAEALRQQTAERQEQMRAEAQERAYQAQIDAENRKIQAAEDAQRRREQAAIDAENRRIAQEQARELAQRQAEQNAILQQQQMEAQFQAQQQALENQRLAAEAAQQQALLQAQYPQYQTTPALPPTVPNAADAGYTDPTALFASLLPAAPQAMVVDPMTLQTSAANNDWLTAESQAWNPGRGEMFGMSGLGRTTPTPGAQQGSGRLGVPGGTSVANTIRTTVTPDNVNAVRDIASSLFPNYVPPRQVEQQAPAPSVTDYLTPTNMALGAVAAFVGYKILTNKSGSAPAARKPAKAKRGR